MTNKLLTWAEIETVIRQEISWIKDGIFPYQKNVNPLNYSDDILYRLIAILIVSGKIRATEYDCSNDSKTLMTSPSIMSKKHGSDWHDSLIKYLASHFSNHGYKCDHSAPYLYYGHADLKIVDPENNKTIYFEIDTVNIFKLYINLLIMKNITIIIITFNKIIKFEL